MNKTTGASKIQQGKHRHSKQAYQLSSIPQNPQGKKRDLTPTGHPLTSQVHHDTSYTHIKHINKCKIYVRVVLLLPEKLYYNCTFKSLFKDSAKLRKDLLLQMV